MTVQEYILVTVLDMCEYSAINPTSPNIVWIGGSRPPDPRLPQAS